MEKAVANYAGKEFSQFKKDLTDLVVHKILPISKEMKKLMNDNSYLESIMKDGKEKAIAVAEPVLREIYKIIGFSDS